MVISRNTNLFHFGVVLFHSCLVCMAMASSNFTDLSALLAFKSELESNNSLVHNWTTTADFCSWIGVSCSKRRQRVTALILPEMGLTGTISPLIGNLSFLSFIDLGINNFHGNLPNEFSRLHRLEVLILDYNHLEGEIPPSLQLCQMLQVMSLANNKFSGVIPRELGNMPVLRTLYLTTNNLEEPLPSTLSNISTLQYLSLGGMGLTGPFPSVIFNMSSLLSLFLNRNSISGNFPENFCHYFPRLQKLDVAKNQLSGQLPASLSQCGELQELYMLFNNFTGSIPEEMGSMSKLKILHLANNSFTGVIPPSLGNISGLEKLWLGSNYLQGNIPGIFGLSTNFIEFLLEGNLLTGVIPPNIFNISSLQVINLSFNNFSGSLPSGTTFWLPNLQRLLMNGNKLSGNIPQFLSNSSRLLAIDLGYNLLTGPIPTSLGNLKQLQFLHLDGNFLTGDGEGLELQFITALTNCRSLERLILESNPLNGILPNSIGNFSDSFQIFYALGCQLKGHIPDEIGSLQNLNMIALSNNNINGIIPTTIGGMERLQRLYFDDNNIEGVIPIELCRLQNLGEVSLQSNRLSGPIPSCIGNLGSLQMLYLSSNNLTSSIPVSLWGLENLLLLNLSFNSLNGRLPSDMRMLNVMANLDISHNQFGGDIPSIIGSFKSLSSLNLSANSFQGSIPPSLGDLVTLDFLDLSQNNLSGNIPMSLVALLHLRYLNLSFNKLSGKIPSGGAFENFTAQSFMENEALCGKPSLQACDTKRVEKSRTKRVLLKFILPAVAFVLIASGFIVTLRYCGAGKKQKDQSSFDLEPGKPRMISYHELRHATNNFCESNLLGKGGSGSVYKALLSDGTEVAVKIFDLQQERAFKSFYVECEVLRNVRHRNLVKVISSCSHPELRALVLQYMCNGSLEKWLYSHNNCLDLLQRVSIMVDVATALEYLHHGQSEPIVHCDMKPSNILLDDDMVAHVADFGIANILAENNTRANTKTLGTIGYVAPEYGSEGRVSTKGDIYSYGILLMETFTRRKPTDEMFSEELTLRKWVNASVPKMVMEIVDDGLLRTDGGKVNEIGGHLQAIMELGLACSEELPENRSDIKDVVVTLNKIKLQLS